jgi:hypothetical protein
MDPFERIAIELIERNPRAWPRLQLDQERVAEFIGLYEGGDPVALPPIDLLPLPGGGYLLAEGHHRLEALIQRWGYRDDHPERSHMWAPARILELPHGRDPVEVAFELGLQTAVTVSKPLTLLERRAAALRLMAERPNTSDREIARLVGLSHQTVGRLRKRSTDHAESDGIDDQEPTESYLAYVTAAEIALRLARGLDRLWEARGLSELILGDKTGRRLAKALTDVHGDDARRWAERLREWAEIAIAELDRGQS